MSAVQKCRVCGRDENLAEPFMDGTCVDCLRKASGLEMPQKRKVDKQNQAAPRTNNVGITTQVETRRFFGDTTEKVYYEGAGIKITATRALFPQGTYTTHGMTSVRWGIVAPNRMGPLLLIGLGALFMTCCGLPLHESLGGGIAIVLGLAMLAGGIWWLQAQKPTYAVFINTAANEQPAYGTDNVHEAERIVSALNQAFVDRG